MVSSSFPHDLCRPLLGARDYLSRSQPFTWLPTKLNVCAVGVPAAFSANVATTLPLVNTRPGWPVLVWPYCGQLCLGHREQGLHRQGLNLQALRNHGVRDTGITKLQCEAILFRQQSDRFRPTVGR